MVNILTNSASLEVGVEIGKKGRNKAISIVSQRKTERE